MNSPIRIQNVSLTDDMLSVDLSDGRVISVPLAWYPKILDSTVESRNNFRLIGRGFGIHWEEIDEDLSLDGIINGIPARPERVA